MCVYLYVFVFSHFCCFVVDRECVAGFHLSVLLVVCVFVVCCCCFCRGGGGGGGGFCMESQQKMAGKCKQPQCTPFPSVCCRSVQQPSGLSFAGGR